MAIYYKTLVEVKVFHEYYLTDSDGKNIFDQALQIDRINFLRDRFLKGETNINEEIVCSVPALSRSLFKDHHLRLVPNYAGYKIAIEVIPQTLVDGTKVYKPKVQLPDDVSIPGLLLKKSNQIESYTNSRLSRAVNAQFYFSNEDFSGAKSFPFLSNAIPAFDGTISYEQGELATHGVNNIRAFYRDTTDAIQWQNVNGVGYANESDRLLVPPGFYYNIRSNSVTTVDVTLKDSTNAIVEEYHFSQSEPIQKVFISVNRDTVKTVPETLPSAELLYSLEVSGSNGYNEKIKLIFYDGEERINDAWALVQLNIKNTNSNFDLLDAQGLLHTRKKPDGTYNPLHPIFEIRVRSRLTFWRYINDEQHVFQNNLHVDQLELNVGKLITKTPRPLSYTPVFFKKPDNSGYYLPNPRPHEPVRSEGNRLYSDVFVSESKDLFPLGP